MWLAALFVLGAPTPIPLTASACDVIDLDEKLCTCTDLINQQFILDCEVPIKLSAINFTDTIGVKVIADPCADPATMTLDVVEKAFGIDVPIQKIVAGSELVLPIPGLALSIPDVGMASVDLDVEFDGDIDELTVKAGVNVCVKTGGETICGQDIPYLQNLFPIWVIDGTWDFGHMCSSLAAPVQ